LQGDSLASMASYHLLRVFCDDDGGGGNELGVFLDGSEVAAAERQPTAAALGYSETVFVDDAERGELRIFTPAEELPFAGHPTVGTAWLLRERGGEPRSLLVPAGELGVRFEGAAAFVSCRPEWGPEWQAEQLESAEAVEALGGSPGGRELVHAWAWADEEAGIVRMRAFPGEGLGIEEDEATGSAAARLCLQLGRELDIRQGRSSRILARPLGDGRVEIGGLTVSDGVLNR
jgi:predicted PhzF superfamily epimerase YddE/YHI9